MKNVMIFITLIVVAVVFYIVGSMPPKREIKRMEQRQTEINKVNLRKQGSTSLYKYPGQEGKHCNYHLRSWDAGKTWYAVEYDKEINGDRWGLTILGEANELYPGLLEHLQAWDSLWKHVEENGPINGSDTGGINALKKAGFTVTTN